MQEMFSIYLSIFVGIIGNGIIGWEIGRKGLIQLGLEGPRNRRVLFAISLWVIAVVWGLVSKIQGQLVQLPTNPHPIWFLLWGVFMVFLGRFSLPKSQRLYNRAKFLHETTPTGNWHAKRPQYEIEAIRENSRLRKAEEIYRQALTILESHRGQGELWEAIRRLRNVAAVYLQLALLYRQRYELEEAAKYAKKALEALEQIPPSAQEEPESLALRSNALFRLTEIDHFQGNGTPKQLRERYQECLAIDQKLGNMEGIRTTESMLDEINEEEALQ